MDLAQLCFLCLKESGTFCPDCSIPYCTKSHFRIHKSKRGYCYPFRTQYSPQVGHYVIATRDIEPLEIILEDDYAVFGPNHDTKPVCLECLLPVDESFLCSRGCGFPMCDEKCSEGSLHRSECDLLSDLPNGFKINVDFNRLDKNGEPAKNCPEYCCITPLRMLTLAERDPDVWDRVDCLMDHDAERRQESVYWDMFEVNVVNYLRVACGLGDKYSEKQILRCIGILRTNAFHMDSPYVKSNNPNTVIPSGRGVFPNFSLINHSCKSNTRYCLGKLEEEEEEDCETKIRARAQIFISKGEEISIQYISFMYGHLKRRQDIKDSWFFECSCPRCSSHDEFNSHMSSLKCEKEDCEGLLVPIDSLDSQTHFLCNNEKCSMVLENEKVKKYFEECEEILYNTYENDVQAYENIIQNFTQKLYENNYLVLTAKKYLADLYGTTEGYLFHQLSEEKLELKMKYYHDFIDTIDKVDPGFTKWKGNVYFRLYKTLFYLINRDQSGGKMEKKTLIKRLKEALDMLEMTTKCLVPEDISTRSTLKAAIKAKKELKEIIAFSDFL